jgi:ABC-type uncharacterized transport system permease subunit
MELPRLPLLSLIGLVAVVTGVLFGLSRPSDLVAVVLSVISVFIIVGSLWLMFSPDEDETRGHAH